MTSHVTHDVIKIQISNFKFQMTHITTPPDDARVRARVRVRVRVRVVVSAPDDARVRARVRVTVRVT